MPTKVRFAGINHTQLPQIVSDGIALKGLPQTAGYPDGYGDLASALADMVAANGILCAAIGDSQFANSFGVEAGEWTRNFSTNRGVFGWLSFYSRQRVNIPFNYDLAVGGSGTAVIKTQVAGVLALNPKPSICFINGGGNDFSSSPSLAVAQSALDNMTSAAMELASSGIIPVLEISVPRATASWTATSSTIASVYNQMLREWCRLNGVILVDYESQYIQLSGDPVVGYAIDDNVHQSSTGAAVRALKYIDAIEHLLPEFTTNTGSPRDAFSLTLNPNGNFIASIAFMTGTSGINTGTGASGVVATGWQNRVLSGTMTAVASKESPRTDGRLGDRQVIALSASNASRYRFTIQNNPVTTGNYAAGDEVYAEIDMEITACAGTIDYIRLVVSDFDGTIEGSRSYAFKDVLPTGISPMPVVPLPRNTGFGDIATTLNGRLRTEKIVIGETFTSIQLIYRVEVEMQAGSSCTIKLGDATIRKA